MKTNIELAEEAGVYCTTRKQTLDAMLDRFAELVRAEQREIDARKADDIAKDLSVVIRRVAEVIAAAIRAGVQE